MIASLGAGMMFKYWPLFFKKDLRFNPESVCLLQASICLGMMLGNYASSFVVSVCGRMPVLYITQSLSCMFLCMVAAIPSLPVPAVVALVLLRNTTQHTNTPVFTTAIMDALPREYRARWTVIPTLRRMSWSGSAGLGGILSDHHGYRFNFCVCAITQFFAQICLIPMSVIQSRQRTS